MKKVLTTAALSSVMVLGLASAALAVHATQPSEVSTVSAKGSSKIMLDGAIRMRGYSQKDSTQDSAATNAYDSRVRLGVKAQVSDAASAYIQFETSDNSSESQDDYTWGDINGGATDGLHKGGAKPNNKLNLEQAWINYKPGNWGVKVGHMPLALGNNLFFDHTNGGDDAIVAYGNPTDSTHVAGILIKFSEQTKNDNSDDLDGYVALITHKYSDNLAVGANWTYLKGGNTAATEDGGITTVAQGMEMSTVGLTVDGKVGAVSYKADAEFQFGDFKDDGTGATVSGDAGGYAYLLAADWDLGGAKVGALFGYGSGDDNSTDTDQDAFINFLTDRPYQTLIANYRFTVPGTFTKYSGLSNMTLYQLNASTKTTCPLTGKDLALKGSLSYMNLSEDYNNYGTNKEDSVGTEVDLIAKWKLTNGLAYKVEAAYLFAGDVFKTAATGAGSDPDDLYFLRHTLELKF